MLKNDVRALFHSVGRFWSWWTDELQSLLPRRLALWLREENNLLAVSLTEKELRITQPAASGFTEVEALAFDDLSAGDAFQRVAEILRRAQAKGKKRIVLLAPADRVIRRSVTLPAAVGRNLREVLLLDLDRLTPFKADRALFSYRIAERHAGSGVLNVALSVLPRAVADPLLNRATELGLPIEMVALPDEILEYGIDAPNFLPPGKQTYRAMVREWWFWALPVVALGLALAALILPVWQKRSLAIELIHLTAKEKERAQVTEGLRARLETMTSEHNFVVQKANDQLPLSILLNELTKLLPDDTFLTTLEVRGKTVNLQGETGASARLIELIEKSPFFQKASFQSPMTQVQGAPAERFQIVAESLPLGDKEAAEKKAPAEPAGTQAAAPTPGTPADGGQSAAASSPPPPPNSSPAAPPAAR